MLRFAWSDLLNNLTQIGLTVSAVALVLFLLRKALKKRYPARAMCLVWAVLALRLLIPVQLTLPDPPVQVTPRTTYLTQTNFTPERLEQAGLPVLEQEGEITTRRWVTDEQAQTLQTFDEQAWTAIDMGRVLLVLWGTGALLFAGWQMYRYLAFHHVLEKSSHPAQRDALLTVFEEQKCVLGITRDIPLRVTQAADCPMLAGFIKPALYLPDEALSEQDAAFIFRHELTHYKRGDLWLKLALVAARAVHWFNPLVHLMARFAQEDIELACDDAVVRGMDVDARRAYGETILRSVEAQVKKRALVSCFTGDKETLMRRFEGLFDKKVKKRGIALVVAAAVLVGTLGCAFSVGESKSELTDEERIALAEQWAQRTESLGYTVKLDGEDTYVLYDMQWDDFPELVVPYRTAEKLTFEKLADGWQVTKGEAVAGDGVTSLDEFRILYENDLGLPDPLEVGKMSFTQLDMDKWGDPTKAAEYLLHLQPVASMGDSSADRTMGDDIMDITFIFDDRSEVTITMVNQFGDGWLPQDFTYDGGKNARTAADLAGQYARGVTHKSGQYIYPILSTQMQQEFGIDRYLPDGGFNWKYGGSSPSYRGYALVPADDADSYLAVFQMYGGGVEDMRSAFLITTAQADGRRVIDSVTEVAESNYTKSDLFKLYYDSGLPWPTVPEGAESFNGASLDTLTRVRDAVETVFGYFGENVEHIEGNQHLYTRESWFTGEVVSEGETEAVVRLNFVDNSPSVDVQMRKTNGYWLPIGLVTQFDEGFGAYLVEGDSPVSQGALPVGATIAQAIENANGEIPLLEAGQTIKLEPVDGKLTATDAVLTDAVIRADGTLQYTDKETQQESIRFTDVYDRGSAVYLYKVEHLMAEALSSTLDAVVYRGVTVTYRTSAYTGTEQEYTAAFVYRLANEGVPNTDYTIHSTEYNNATYGYTLTLPDCFVEQGYEKESVDGVVTFGLKNALPGYTDDPTDGGTVMTLQVQATESLKAQFGEDWQANYPVPCKQLAERDGLTYYLTFASDVQYDPSDENIAAAYTEMYQAAQEIGPEAFSLVEPNAEQMQARMTAYLQSAAPQDGFNHYAQAGGSLWVEDSVTLVRGNAADVVFSLWDAENHPYRAVQSVQASSYGGYHLISQEWKLDADEPTDSREKFDLRYGNTLGMPEFDQTRVEALLADTAITALRDPGTAAEWIFGLSGGTAEDIVVHPIKKQYTLTYRWLDGGEVELTMQGVTLGGAEQPIYLPIAFDGIGWFADPYTYMMCKEKGDFSTCTVEALVWYLAQSDGATTEGILAGLDKRWQQDADEVEQAMDGANTTVQKLWQQHKAANPDIFGA
ncbi:MAG TPA: M56 family metallopeptidase [Candidatus Agathobaculum merdipullorum]|nr:M56 family metallopeptidase [Candidatus Agathobaculum merdipullorum]